MRHVPQRFLMRFSPYSRNSSKYRSEASSALMVRIASLKAGRLPPFHTLRATLDLP